MSRKVAELGERDLMKAALKTRARLYAKFGEQRVNVWFLANDQAILEEFVRGTYIAVREQIEKEAS